LASSNPISPVEGDRDEKGVRLPNSGNGVWLYTSLKPVKYQAQAQTSDISAK